MEKCFVIQPFDRGKFDKRFEDVLVPAIADAALEPYRVDRDPSVNIPIEEIESGIRSARMCLADITTDNPNVWFELGYAIALHRDVILVCSTERTTRFPFDVQHRSILQYETDSPSDFEDLRKRVSGRIRALIERGERLGAVASMSELTRVKGLAAHEIGALVTIASAIDEPQSTTSAFSVRRDMEGAGFTQIATTLAVRTLLRNDFIEATTAQDGYGEPYTAYKLTEIGMDWLMQNQDQFILRIEEKKRDDIPF